MNTVRPEGKESPVHSLHHDLLLPCGYLPNTVFEEPVQQNEHRRPRTRSWSRIEDVTEALTEQSHSESDSEYVHSDVPGESLESRETHL